MKKFSPKNDLRKIFSWKLLLPFIIVFTILFGNIFGFGDIVRGGVAYVFQEPLSSSRGSAYNLRYIFQSFRDAASLRQRLVSMQQELDRVRADNSRLQTLAVENEVLRGDLNLVHEQSLRRLPAEIYQTHYASGGQWFYVNKGFDDGVRSGLLVTAGQDILLGRVDKVYRFASRVQMLSHPDVAMEVFIPRKGSALLTYDSRIGLLVEEIDYSDDVSASSPVYYRKLARDGSVRRFLVGYAGAMRQSEDRVTQNAVVDLASNVEELLVVSVILD